MIAAPLLKKLKNEFNPHGINQPNPAAGGLKE